MPAFVRKSLETDKKRKALRSTNPRKQEEQTRFKSINRSATEYPSPPGVEGALLDPRVSPRAAPHQKQATGKNANGTQDQAPESQIDAVVYRLYGLTKEEIWVVERAAH